MYVYTHIHANILWSANSVHARYLKTAAEKCATPTLFTANGFLFCIHRYSSWAESKLIQRFPRFAELQDPRKEEEKKTHKITRSVKPGMFFVLIFFSPFLSKFSWLAESRLSAIIPHHLPPSLSVSPSGERSALTRRPTRLSETHTNTHSCTRVCRHVCVCEIERERERERP